MAIKTRANHTQSLETLSGVSGKLLFRHKFNVEYRGDLDTMGEYIFGVTETLAE